VEVHEVRTRDAYMALVHGPVLVPRWSLERHLAEIHQGGGPFTVPGFCAACARAVDFRADFEWAWEAPDGLLVPNWRDRLACPLCGMSGRERRMTELVAAVADAATPTDDRFRIYLMEMVSPLYRWVAARYAWADLIGSELLGDDLPAGTVRDGIRHENAEALSFADGTIDLLVTCDVLEHVNDPSRAFAEIARVLRPGGRAILTFPMDPRMEGHQRRAEIVDGAVRHVLPPVYHGNPLSAEGALVFTDFGWHVLDDMRRAGLHDPTLNLYWAYELGYLGLQFYFVASRA
jgi:hypothetical protein